MSEPTASGTRHHDDAIESKRGKRMFEDKIDEKESPMYRSI